MQNKMHTDYTFLSQVCFCEKIMKPKISVTLPSEKITHIWVETEEEDWRQAALSKF